MLVELFLRKLILFESCLSLFLILETIIDVSKPVFRMGLCGFFLFCHSLAFENDLISKMYRDFQCSLFVDQATPFGAARVLLAFSDFARWKSSDFFNRNPGWGNTLIHTAMKLPLFGIEWMQVAYFIAKVSSSMWTVIHATAFSAGQRKFEPINISQDFE